MELTTNTQAVASVPPVDAADDEQPPAKIAKTEASVTVSERRLRAEIQVLLVGTDLTQTTVGQLRETLEKRVGLAVGDLSSKKRMRRWVAGVIQNEVMKKGQRSSHCEQIVKALAEFDEYPSDSRQMLIEGLPHALLSAEEKLHNHQVMFLSIVREAVGDAERSTSGAQSAWDVRSSESECGLSASAALCEASAKAEADAKAAVEAAADTLRDAELEVDHAKAQVAEAESTEKATQEAVTKIQESLRNAVMAQDMLRLLLDPRHEEDGEDMKAKTAASSAVLNYLRDESAETPLLCAAPFALQKAPAHRGPFDMVTVESIQEIIDERVCSEETMLQAQPTAAAEAALLSASGLQEAARATVAERVNSRDAAQALLDGAAIARKEAEAELQKSEETKAACIAEQERLTKKAFEITEVLALLEQIITNKKVAVEDPCDVPVEVAAEEALPEDAAEDDGGELIDEVPISPKAHATPVKVAHGSVISPGPRQVATPLRRSNSKDADRAAAAQEETASQGETAAQGETLAEASV